MCIRTLLNIPSTMDTLHESASTGSVERTLDLLSIESTDIDACHEDDGWTPLMIAAEAGYVRIIRVLLKYGARVSFNTDDGHTALHVSIHNKHLAASKTLIRAGADLEARATCFTLGPTRLVGHTPLHLAAGKGFDEGVRTLIAAGAYIDSRLDNGATPLYLSACCGKLQAVKILLCASANPLLPVGTNLPIDVAAQEGHLHVVRELVQRFGLDGCSHAGAVEALDAAALQNNSDIVSFLCDSGAVDVTGTAFCAAVEGRAVACVKLLLRRRGGHVGKDRREYINIARGRDNPLLCTFDTGRCVAPRMAKFLIEQGVDTASNVPFKFTGLDVIREPPLVAAKLTLQHTHAKYGREDNEVADGLVGVIRLLQQIEAVHAKSWAWPSKSGCAVEKKRGKKSASITRMLPILRKRAKQPKVLLGALARYNSKRDGSFDGVLAPDPWGTGFG